MVAGLMPAPKPLVSETVPDCVPKPRRLPVHCVDILAMGKSRVQFHHSLPCPATPSYIQPDAGPENNNPP
jgi:hypothetical protein